MTTENSRGANLVVENLTVAYGAHSAVIADLSMTVSEGMTLALLGANGAGKTTVMRAITGLLPIHDGRMRGRVVLDGEDITHLSADARVHRGIAQTMEGRRIFPDLTVEENLMIGAFTLKRRSDRVAAAEAVFERFPEIAEKRGIQAGYLSGGQQQMLAIGRALMSKPRLLMLDEPSLGLSPKLVNRVGDIIREINQQGTTVVLIEQNVSLGLEVAEYVIALEPGRVALSGTAEELSDDERIQAAYFGGHIE